MDLTFTRIAESELQLLRAWHTDPELQRRISYPTAAWFAYVNTTGNFAWLIFANDIAVGYVQFGYEREASGSFAFAVNPSLRGQGYGKRILHALLQRPEVLGLNTLEGFVEPDNIASQRCLIAAGFRLVSETPDEEGMLKFVYP
ncbi:MAG: GNAT family N-acetyltransferase [Anaerolineae bacterium]